MFEVLNNVATEIFVMHHFLNKVNKRGCFISIFDYFSISVNGCRAFSINFSQYKIVYSTLLKLDELHNQNENTISIKI